MKSKKLLASSMAMALLCFLSFMYWYEWSASALSPSEIEDYLAKIEAQFHEPGGRHDLSALRTFLEADDGEPIYTVNMYSFQTVADYPEGSGFGGSGPDAYERFSSVMIPLMIRRGSHPIYGSNWVDRANSKWDRIVIVRYRSRRDLVDIFATDAFADASLHKWASLRGHDRMLVQALHIPDGRYAILFLALIAGFVTYGVGTRAKRRQHQAGTG